MKALLLILLGLNLALGAWLWVGGPVDQVHESTREQMQVVADQFQTLSDADVARMRGQSERAAAAAAAAAAPPPGAPIDLPMADCVWVVNLPSEGAAKRLRARLGDSGLGEHALIESENQKVRLRLSGVDAAGEQRLQQLIKDSPKLALEHCVGSPAAHSP